MMVDPPTMVMPVTGTSDDVLPVCVRVKEVVTVSPARSCPLTLTVAVLAVVLTLVRIVILTLQGDPVVSTVAPVTHPAEHDAVMVEASMLTCVRVVDAVVAALFALALAADIVPLLVTCTKQDAV